MQHHCRVPCMLCVTGGCQTGFRYREARIAHPDVDGDAADAGARQSGERPVEPLGRGIAVHAVRIDLQRSASLNKIVSALGCMIRTYGASDSRWLHVGREISAAAG